ncbi:hypothetical protein [Paenibacillus pabuli]
MRFNELKRLLPDITQRMQKGSTRKKWLISSHDRAV